MLGRENDSPVDLSGREGAPWEPELTEEVCQLARYELEKNGLLESRKTNREEDLIVREFSTDIQLFCDTWVEKKLAVEE